MTSKVTTMRDAVTKHVPDGASVALGCALEPAIPFAFAHELIRQRRRDLHLIGPISDIAFDQLIGAGCVAVVSAAWVGNVSAGLAHAYRRAMEQGIPRPIEVRDHSNFSIAQALLAGALGAPYLPTRSLLGSDIPRANGTFREASDPFSGDALLLIPAITPDVTAIAVQRADEDGNAHLWGPWGVSQEAALAARATIVIADEIVARSVIASDPNRTIVPGTKVTAVVHEPGACHPSPLQGRYRRDHEFFHQYHAATRTPEGFAAWIREWVSEVSDRRAYLAKLGARWGALRDDGVPAALALF
ncbi:MAG: CoA transferase subunit A [Chloroflexi bacterium]|nr:MAG: CoA transferase subunit A [Chloroflexota bacterium]TMF26617.1 MAG: CoA transferase subunit A [Chloroflexota bacterium]